MKNQELLQIKLNVIAGQNVNDMLPISTHLIRLSFEKNGFSFKKGSECGKNRSWYVILKNDAVVGTTIFEMFKSFEEQPIETQRTIYRFFEVEYKN